MQSYIPKHMQQLPQNEPRLVHMYATVGTKTVVGTLICDLPSGCGSNDRKLAGLGDDD